jgi:hydroxylaminobenzene mutase
MVLPSLLLKSGALQLAVTFVWGTQIPQTPFPRIALSAHMNMIQEGLLAIAAGYLVRDSGLVHLSEWQMGIVVGAHLGLWVFDLIGMCNSFWGTNKTLTLVCNQVDASVR